MLTINFNCLKVKPWNEEAKFWAQVFASANSALNPLIYGITNGSFRKAICLLYPKLSWFLRLDSPSSRSRRVTTGNGHNSNGGGPGGPNRQRDLVKSTFTMSNCGKKKTEHHNHHNHLNHQLQPSAIKTISGRSIQMVDINVTGIRSLRR